MSFEEIFPNERLRHARYLKGWTQSDLAAALDTDFETVSRWERGIAVPSLFYQRTAHPFPISISYFCLR